MPPCIVPVAKKTPTDFICILRSIRNPVFGGSRIIVTVPLGNTYFRLVKLRESDWSSVYRWWGLQVS